MRIVSLEPFLTDLVQSLGATDALVGAVGGKVPKNAASLGETRSQGSFAPVGSFLRGATTSEIVNCSPDLVLLSLPESVEAARDPAFKSQATQKVQAVSQELTQLCGKPVMVKSYAPVTFDQVLATFENLGKDLGCTARGHEIAQRSKAQCMDWADNFYDRTKNKRVAILVGVEPLVLGGYWLPDMISMASCISAEPVAGRGHRPIEWGDLLKFRPDVLMVSLQGCTLDECKRSFKVLEKLPNWESAPAVKRGEVFFSEGDNLFLKPSQALVKGMGVLVSAIAGIDSGYITERDSFFRLRALELQRHKL